MDWKQKLGVDKFIINEEVDTYLKKYGFYESDMSPRFSGNHTFHSSITQPRRPCLRLDTEDPRDVENTMRIFINRSEVYMEVQTSRGSFDRSFHRNIETPINEEEIDTILNAIANF